MENLCTLKPEKWLLQFADGSSEPFYCFMLFEAVLTRFVVLRFAVYPLNKEDVSRIVEYKPAYLKKILSLFFLKFQLFGFIFLEITLDSRYRVPSISLRN